MKAIFQILEQKVRYTISLYVLGNQKKPFGNDGRNSLKNRFIDK